MRYVANAVDENPAYSFYLPITNFLWRRLGWEPISILVGKKWDEKWLNNIKSTCSYIKIIDALPGYRSSTTAQASRLFAATLVDTGYLMTSDVDMLVVSNDLFDRRDPKTAIQVYGADLYGPTRFPMCYVGMDVATWRSTFHIGNSLEQALEKIRSRRDDWNLDENFLTEILRPQSHHMQLISRGTVAGMATRRMDRAAWNWTGQKDIIDMHCGRPGKAHWGQTRSVLAAYLTTAELTKCDEFVS